MIKPLFYRVREHVLISRDPIVCDLHFGEEHALHTGYDIDMPMTSGYDVMNFPPLAPLTEVQIRANLCKIMFL